jgi:Peptidase family C25
MRCRIAALALVVVAALAGLATPQATQVRPAGQAERVVYVAGGLTEDDLIPVSAAVAAGGPGAVLLLDTPASAASGRQFLTDFRPARTIPVGPYADGGVGLRQRLGVAPMPVLECKNGRPTGLWQSVFPKAERVVLCPATPRSQLLQAACLAGALPAPLWVIRDGPEEADELRRQLTAWDTKEVLAVGAASRLGQDLGDVRCTELSDARAVAAAYLREQLRKGPVQTLVVANPLDRLKGMARMSSLAPWVALQRRAALVLTNPAGDNTAEAVREALRNPDLRQAETLILIADMKAIPMPRRPNPAKGKDAFIEMEPLTPEGSEPFSFATGRLFHPDRGVVALMLARQQQLAEGRSPPKALVASNPGGSLPLLEVFSRHTARELRNRGYACTALFEHEIDPARLRRLLPEQDIFLWEGHYRTMVDEYGLPGWTEPLRPSLIFLQSCLALNEAEAQPLLQRGAVALVGSSTRIYSATGGAFTLAFFDALLYDDATLGGALRQAKNFLLAYALLKEKRLGDKAKLSGANIRSAWAFTLWGDPTLRLPRPAPPDGALPAVRHQIKNDRVVLTLPEKMYEGVKSVKYETRAWPNARLAGLTTHDDGDGLRQLVPLVFAEVRLTPPGPGKTPRLQGKLADRRWVFVWDDRRACGYLIVVPPGDGRRELRFDVRWEG